MAYESILFISDMHAPFEHKDTIYFLKEVKKKYKPDLIVCVGDEVDLHTISFHDKDPNIGFSPSSELESAVASIQNVHRIFPEMLLCDSNHGSLVFRKALSNGLPKIVFKEWKEVLMTPKWKWSSYHLINGNILAHHGKSAAFLKLSLTSGYNTVEGHYHTKQGIVYNRGMMTRWSMKVGCMINNKELAFAYNKNNVDDVLLGHGLVYKGHPKILHMEVNKDNRWNGLLP